MASGSGPGRHGDEAAKQVEALVQHHGRIRGRLKAVFRRLFGR